MRVLFVLGLLLASVQTTEPTMQETADWLTKNLPAKASYSGGEGRGETSFRVTEASVTDCVCKLRTTHQISTKGGVLKPLITELQLSIPFASIDAAKIRLETNTTQTPPMVSLFLQTDKDAKVIHTVDVRRRETDMRELSVLYFGEKETAERFEKAFKRLTVLCHQKTKEPF